MANVSSATEIRGQQNTVLSDWVVIAGPVTALRPESEVIVDETGQKFQVVGAVAARPYHRPEFHAAPVRLISDMQT